MTDFAAVDAGDERALVAMMDATDAWPAVEAARAWVLDQTTVADDAIVVDAGCGPGTFGGLVAGGPIDLDRSLVMLHETRRRRTEARVVLADISHLPVRDGAAALVRAERVLQWTAAPYAALRELHRVTAPGGWLAVTDTDWATLTVAHPDDTASTRLTQAALRWVPHARLARDLPTAIATLGAVEVRTVHHTATIAAWDPDDAAQRDGPPGLPLHSIAGQRVADLDLVAERARAGTFRAEVTMVTVLARAT